MITRKHAIPAIAALFVLTGCGASAAANTAAGHSVSPATVVAAHSAATPANPDGAPAGALPFPVGSVVWLYHPNGTITYPLSQQMGLQITHSSGGILFPTAAQAASGQPLHSELTMTVAEDGQTITEVAHITVQGEGTQTVTVPAGTFRNATVLKMTMDATVDKISLDFTFKYWVAPGTGEVKSEGFFGGSTPDDIEVLLSFTK